MCAPTSRFNIVLSHVLQFGHPEVVELLIAYGADVNHKLPDGYTTPLYVATLEGHNEVMDLLLGAGAIASVDEDDLLEYPEEQISAQVDPTSCSLTCLFMVDLVVLM